MREVKFFLIFLYSNDTGFMKVKLHLHKETTFDKAIIRYKQRHLTFLRYDNRIMITNI
jgi:hypothetical protein